MNTNSSFQRLTAVLAIIAGIAALLSLVVGLSGVDYDFEVFSDPSSLIAAGTTAAALVRWSYWLNMVGNYLFLIPLALFLYHWLGSKNNLFAQLYTISGYTYILLGAAGSAILAAAWPFLMEQYATTPQADLITHFQVVTAIAETGLHGVIQNFAGAVWFLGMGSLLRQKRAALGIVAMVVGAFLVLNTLGNMFNIEALSLIGLTANILLGPIWTIWIGLALLKTNNA
ncbi:MAG: hypothetical protein AAF614_03500 [Chloroflexota bacterium]